MSGVHVCLSYATIQPHPQLWMIKPTAKNAWYLKTYETTKSLSKQHRICPIHGSEAPWFSTIPPFFFIIHIWCLDHIYIFIFNTILSEPKRIILNDKTFSLNWNNFILINLSVVDDKVYYIVCLHCSLNIFKSLLLEKAILYFSINTLTFSHQLYHYSNFQRQGSVDERYLSFLMLWV